MRTAALLMCALFAGTLWASQPPAIAPPWTLQTPDGESVRFPQDAGGDPVVLMFWPSWCPFSRALQPYVQDIWEDYRDHGVKLWTINILEDADPLAAMRERGLSFPLLLDGDPLRHRYGIVRTPWLVVIDARQRIVYTRPPSPPSPIDVAKAVRQTLNELLGDRAVALPGQYPPPYALHLKREAEVVDRSRPVKLAQDIWVPWITAYLEALETPSEPVCAGTAPVDDGKSAIQAAAACWTDRYGQAEVRRQAPYRAYRKDNDWMVFGLGLERDLGNGLIAVIERATGDVLSVDHGGADD